MTRAARAMARGDLDQVVPVDHPRRAGGAGRGLQRDGPDDPRVPPGRDRPAPPGPADGAGDDRLVPRPGRRRRPDRARSSGPTRPPGGSSGVADRRDGPIPWTPAGPAPRAPGRGPRRPARPPARSAWSTPSACRDDGQERFFLPRVLAIRDEGQGLLGAAVVLHDVTRFRLLDQLKSDMVSTVSHELKTPLTGMQMAVHLLLEEVVGPLEPEAGRAAAGGPAGLGPAPGDGQRPARPDPDRAGAGPARPPARGARPTWSARPSSGSSRGPGTPGSTLEGRGRRSACRRSRSIASGSGTSSTTWSATPWRTRRRGGSVRLSAEAEAGRRRSGSTVEDTGEGIAAGAPAADLREVLPGARARSRRGRRARPGDRPRDRRGPRRPDRGRAASRPGDDLHLPPADRPGRGRSAEPEERRHEPTPARILIVDDEPNVRLVFRTALESAGYRVAAAEDGEAALAWLEADRVDLVLLDLQMPGMGGMERARAGSATRATTSRSSSSRRTGACPTPSRR